MKPFYAAALSATMIAAPLATPVWAQSTSDDQSASELRAFAPDRAAEYVGARALVNSEAGIVPAGWVSDVLVNVNGETVAILVETDATVGAPSKLIAVDTAALAVATTEDGEGLLIQGADPIDLAQAQPFDDSGAIDDGLVRLSQVQIKTDDADTGAANTAAAPQAPAPAEPVTVEATATDDMRPLVALSQENITSDVLNEAEAFDAEAESLGEVAAVVMTPDGAVEGVVVKIGGFLGFGAKPVAVMMNEMQVMLDPADGAAIVQIAVSRDVLSERPAFEG